MPDLSNSSSSKNGKVMMAEFGTSSSANTSDVLKLFSRLDKNDCVEL